MRGSQRNWSYRRDLIEQTEPDIININELWRKKDISGYTSYHTKDRDTATGKVNTSIFIKEGLRHTRIAAIDDENIIVIGIGKPITTYVACIYMRCGDPGQNNRIKERLKQVYSQIQSYSIGCNFFITGDFNHPNPNCGVDQLIK